MTRETMCRSKDVGAAIKKSFDQLSRIQKEEPENLDCKESHYLWNLICTNLAEVELFEIIKEIKSQEV